MIYYDRTDVSEGIDVNKTSESNHNWYFLNNVFQHQRNVCNRYHDVVMLSLNLSDIAILNIQGSDYRCILTGISKNRTINLMQNVNLTEKKTERSNIKYNNFLLHLKIGK